jgi:hypothetical protein
LPDPSKYPLFRLFEPTEGKIVYFAKKLLDEYLYLDDQWRNYTAIYQIITGMLMDTRRNVIYEIGQFDGLLGFTGILSGWKATLTFKLWNKERWGPDFVRQASRFIREVMDELQLIRLETSSPDPRIVKMAKMIHFEVEGVQKYNFLWDGKFFDNYMMVLLGREPVVEEK